MRTLIAEDDSTSRGMLAAEDGPTEGPGVFSPDALLERLDGDREVMAEVLDLFVTESRAYLTRAADAVNAGDWQQLGRIAHGLKGAAANVGAEAARASAAVLETTARSPDPSETVQQLADLEAAIEVICADIGDILQKGGGDADKLE